MTATTPAFDIIITEVTNLGGKIGAAGWCVAERRMIRPAPDPEEVRWPVEAADPDLIAVGNVLRFRPTGEPGRRPAPFAREDVVTAPDPVLVGRLSGAALMEALRPTERDAVSAIFGARLRSGTHVVIGDDCPSLAAVRTWAGHSLGFDEWERDGQPRLRCVFTDADGARLSLSVMSRALASIHAADGLDGLTDLARRHRRAHVRLGLEPPDAEGRVHLRVNDVLFH